MLNTLNLSGKRDYQSAFDYSNQSSTKFRKVALLEQPNETLQDKVFRKMQKILPEDKYEESSLKIRLFS